MISTAHPSSGPTALALNTWRKLQRSDVTVPEFTNDSWTGQTVLLPAISTS